MAVKTISIRNDVPDSFLSLFAEGGAFAGLTKRARTPDNPVDLQFRNTQGRKPWATLYLGTSKIVDIRFDERRRHLKIEPQRSRGSFGHELDEFSKKYPELNERWGNWESVDEAAASWGNVGEEFVDLLANARGRALRYTGRDREGFLQAGIAKPPLFNQWSIINRESVVSYQNDEQRRELTLEAVAPVEVAARSLRSQGHDWTQGEKHFGNELDALGVDNEGNLLAIEVKGGYDTGGVGWTPAQVMVYARLLRQWLDMTTEDPHAVVGKSLRQRQELGLAGNQELATEIKIVPVIVIGQIQKRKSAKTATERMMMVRSALKETGNDLEDLRVFQIEGHELCCSELEPGEPLRAVEQ